MTHACLAASDRPRLIVPRFLDSQADCQVSIETLRSDFPSGRGGKPEDSPPRMGRQPHGRRDLRGIRLPQSPNGGENLPLAPENRWKWP